MVIYLATDSAAAIQAYKERYGARARTHAHPPPHSRRPAAPQILPPVILRSHPIPPQVVYRVDAIRSTGLEAVHLAKGNRASGRKQIRDVVLDALLLGRRALALSLSR